MSKEKQCECCHEWWHDSDVKENLCPNCYDYFKQLKRQLEEKEKQIDIISRDNNSYKYNIDEQKRIFDDFAKQLKEKDNYHLRYKLAGADETIANLRQQLEEKDKEIEKIKTKQKPIVMHSKENYYFLEEENIKLHFAQKQLAIQELERLKEEFNGAFSFSTQQEMFDKYIDKQIKGLRGAENDK